ncbi:helix-turn-helix domain-containing protein [Arthrobacter luteolus]|uniref:helix-turn-helix domain-containing protein n=1 Tax=Arthrobacter luteolus TaxID=98672 RepID=UPI00384C57B4
MSITSMGSQLPPRTLDAFAAGADPQWAVVIQRMWNERGSLVYDFLGRFKTISYGAAQVSAADVHRTAVDTMDRFLYRMVDVELPADLRNLPREIAARRVGQGVPLHAFLKAVRHDFRVLWKGLERVAGPTGAPLLMANMDRVLDAVETYTSDVQQAFLEEEALVARDRQLYQRRVIARLFGTEPTDLAEVARDLRVRPSERFELLAVGGTQVLAAQRLATGNSSIFAHEEGEILYLFRPVRAGKTWADEPPSVSGGYVPEVANLGAVPAAAASARILAAHAKDGLCTVESAWMRLAADQLETAFPGFVHGPLEVLAACTEHERTRLLEVAASYSRTGSIKATAQELYCHRNTVVNRLHSLHEVLGLDLTVPAQAARALVILAACPDFATHSAGLVASASGAGDAVAPF